MKQRNLSTSSAILLNLHVTLGAGFFIAVQGMKEFGLLFSCAMWLLGGILFIPLTKIFAELATRYPVSGGVYAYPKEAFGKHCARFVGLFFFVGVALCNGAVIGHFIQEFLKTFPVISPLEGPYKIVFLFVVASFAVLSVMGARYLASIEKFISVTKILSILIIVIIGFTFFSTKTLFAFPSSIGQALNKSLLYLSFAYLGVEACCAMADQVKDIGRVTYLSLFFAALLYIIFQAIFCCIDLDPVAMQTSSWLSVRGLASLGLLFSILIAYFASIYGGFMANNWNLFSIVQEMDIIPLNKQNLLYLCSFVQAVLTAFALYIPKALAISVVTTTLVYGVVVLAYAKIFWKEKQPFWTISLALVSIVIMIYGCFNA